MRKGRSPVMGNALLSYSDFSLLFISDTGLCHSFQMIGMQ